MVIPDTVFVTLFALFIASTLNERIIDFIKLNFPTLWMKNFHFKDEMSRRRRIWLTAFILGIITSHLVGINILDQISNQSNIADNEGILGPKDEGMLRAAFGLALTALFVSLGSKFWHDLLDIALMAKRAKSKIQDFNPSDLNDIKQVDKYLEENEYDIATKALFSNTEKLSQKYGDDTSKTVGYETVDGEYRVCIQVFSRENRSSNNATIWGKLRKHIIATDSLHYRTDYGYAYRFPIVVYYPGQATASEGNGKPSVLAGGGLFNKHNSANAGTFGCIVRKKMDANKNPYLLTCYHCVKLNGVHNWNLYDASDGQNEVFYKRFSSETSGTQIGTIEKAYRDNRMDIALIKATDPKTISDYIWTSDKTVPNGVDTVTWNDCKDRRQIWFSGISSGATEAFIINHNFHVQIKYPDDKHWMYNTIVISQTKTSPYKSPCAKGDSGAIIIDLKSHQALGMIVAVDKSFGYAIPMNDILDMHGLALYRDANN